MRKLFLALAAAALMAGCSTCLGARQDRRRRADRPQRHDPVHLRSRRRGQRQVGVQRALRHAVAAVAGRRCRQGVGRLCRDRPRRRQEAMGLQGQAALLLRPRHQGRRDGPATASTRSGRRRGPERRLPTALCLPCAGFVPGLQSLSGWLAVARHARCHRLRPSSWRRSARPMLDALGPIPERRGGPAWRRASDSAAKQTRCGRCAAN